jgi:hypothetical protein
VDARQEGIRAALGKPPVARIADLEQHPVTAAPITRGLDGPVALLLDPVDLGNGTIPRMDLRECPLSLEDGAHDACLVPTGIAA